MAGDFGNPMGKPPVDAPVSPTPVSLTPDERTWGMLAHLSSIIALLLGGLTFLGPLIVWLIKKDQSAFVADQGKEALNFQIAVLLASLVCGVTCVLAILIPVIIVANIIYSIMAAMEANKGVYYRYPYTLRLIN